MSDRPLGPGYWQASDGRWYPPDSVSGQQASTSPGPAGGQGGFGPPPGQNYGQGSGQTPPAQPGYGQGGPGQPGYGPPPGGGYGPPGQSPYGSPPGAQAPYAAPGYGPGYAAPPSSGNGGRTALIVLAVIGGIFVLLIGGCSVLIFAAGNAVEDVADDFFVDFSNAQTSTDPVSCRVDGLDFADDYRVYGTVTNNSGETSAYRYEYELLGPGDTFIGSDYGIIDRLEAGDTTEANAYGIVDGTVPPEDVTCSVTELLRTPVS